MQLPPSHQRLLAAVAALHVTLSITTVLGIKPLTTGDGFGLTFTDDNNPSIAGVTINGLSASKGVRYNGGFRLSFAGERPTVVLGEEMIKNGDLTSSSAGWNGDGVFEENAGRDGTGAVCLTPKQSYKQVRYFNETNKNAFGVRVSGWSKAEGVNGAENYNYSLYMDIRYEDNTGDFNIAATVITYGVQLFFTHTVFFLIVVPCGHTRLRVQRSISRTEEACKVIIILYVFQRRPHYR